MRTLLAAVLVALALPAAAAAHATLVRTSPPNGAVLDRAPHAVRVVFDDGVERGPGNEAVRNGGGSVLAGEPRVVGGRTLVLPLRRGLADGAYSVRWSILSDDGHLERGVLAFAVGVGQPRPVAQLGAGGTGPQPASVAARWLFLAGVLTAVGIALFALVARPADEERVALTLATGATLAALGAADEAHRVELATRAGTALLAGAALAVLVALAAAAATLERRALRPALLLALPLVAVPTVAGHALDRGLSRVNVAADVLHVAGASAWIGALLGLVLLRRVELRLVVGGIALLALTGVVRASCELLAVSQLWETGYGRALLVKTGLLLVAVAAGLRRRVPVELVAVVVLVGAVAVLVLERPGRNAATAVHAAVPSQPQPAPPRPPRGAVIAAREAGPYGVAVEAEPQALTAVVLSPSGGGASGLPVTIDGRPAVACGSGCYRLTGTHGDTVDVVVDGYRARVVVPANAPDATARLRAFERRYRALRSVDYVERLASGPTDVVFSSWRVEAPDKVRYAIAGGAEAIIVGDRRWDRDSAGAKWVESPQTPLTQPVPPWASAVNARLVAPGTVTFADPTIPAFFELTLRADGRPRAVRMTAAAHFMRDSYVRFDSGQPLRPPR